MKQLYIFHILLALLTALTATSQERLIILNEGDWQADNGRLSYFDGESVVSNQWFMDQNGTKLGDTPNDIIQINDSLLAITVNWSNIVQFITPEGKSVAATEDVPNNRCLASDGRFLYVTSYAHQCSTDQGIRSFTKGFVAKIDIATRRVVDACEVGYEPEGIVYRNGYLFVANSGGYAFQENHDYETTVSILNASTLQPVRTIDTGQINLSGSISQSGKYLLISSLGDYYNTAPATIVMDADKAAAGQADCFVVLPYASTYHCTNRDGNFFAIGSAYSYLYGDYEFNYLTIDPSLVMASGGITGVTQSLPGELAAKIAKMSMPYCIYVNPYTGYIYATDAASFASAGALYQWAPDGKFVGKYKLYINPGTIIALPPDGSFGAIEQVSASVEPDSCIYNLQGIRISTPVPGQIFIQNGKLHRL